MARWNSITIDTEIKAAFDATRHTIPQRPQLRHRADSVQSESYCAALEVA